MKNLPLFLLFILSISILLLTCTEDDPEIDITDIQFDGDKVTVTEGFTYDLTTVIEVTGSDTDQAEISFSSSDASVASVSGNVLTAEKVGTTTVTATEANSGLTASVEVEVIANIIAVTGIELDKSGANLKVGETLQLTATISPEDASEQGVKWSVAFPSESKSSEDEPTDIATVSETGLVTAKAAGDVVITVETNDGGFAASTSITVTGVAVTDISLSASSLSVNIGETGSLVATITPSNATNKNVIWSLTLADEGEPESYATIDAQSGEVTGVSECDACGLAIVATTSDGALNATADVFVVYIPVTSVVLEPSTFTVNVDDTQQMTATILPSNASNKSLTWTIDQSSSNCRTNAAAPVYATVNENGLVTGEAPEGCYDLSVIATSADGPSGSADFDVNQLITSLSIVDGSGLEFTNKHYEFDYYESPEQLFVNILPIDASNQSITWSSDDDQTIEVDQNGNLTGIADGTARITVTTDDGSGLSDYIDVTFNDI